MTPTPVVLSARSSMGSLPYANRRPNSESCVAGSAVAFASARRFDLLALGERTASHLGVRVERLRIVSIIVVAILTGAAVAYV